MKGKKQKSPQGNEGTRLKRAGVLTLDVVLWLLGAFLYAAGIVCFITPARFAAGGVSGIAILINYFFSFIPTGAVIFALNIPLFIISWKKFGFKFIARTVVATAFVSLLIDVLSSLAPRFNLIYAGDEKLVAAIFGGALCGGGIGIVFLRGATTGGIDILARLLRLKFPHISIGQLIMFCDLIVVVVSGIVYHSIESVLYSLIVIFLSGKAVDYVVAGSGHSRMLMIMTSSPEEVTRDVTLEIGRGVSIIPAVGGYTHEEKKMLLCVVHPHEVSAVRKIVGRYDEKPFIIITESSEVLGQGFKPHSDTL